MVARLGPHTTIRCQVESPYAREDIPFWNAEPGVDAPPLANPSLAYYGQKVIQVSIFCSRHVDLYLLRVEPLNFKEVHSSGGKTESV